MLVADGGGGGFSVDPAALSAAGSRVRAISGQAREAGASGSLNACVTTGYPALDGALEQFDARWSTAVSRTSDAGRDLGGSLSSASSAYLFTDGSAVP
jgi:hypothetical protein